MGNDGGCFVFILAVVLGFAGFGLGQIIGREDGRIACAIKYNVGHYDAKTSLFVFDEVKGDEKGGE